MTNIGRRFMTNVWEQLQGQSQLAARSYQAAFQISPQNTAARQLLETLRRAGIHP